MGSFGGTLSLAKATTASAMAAYLLGLLGNATALFLYLSSIRDFVRICKTGTLGKTKVFPYMAGVVNCFVWAMYGLPSVQSGGELSLAINAIGLISNVIYTIIILRYAGEEKCFMLCYVLLIEVIITGCLGLLLVFLPPTAESQIYSLGVCGAITGTIMYVVPLLTDMYAVWNARSVQHISLMGVAAGLLNAEIWTIYSLIPPFKAFTFAPNIVGMWVGLLQIIVYVYFEYHRKQVA